MNTVPNGLIRIICLDAHVPGKVMAIKVREHANLSGTNGAGKTTLLKLVPFFYGSSPTDVIPRKSTRTRFVDYYLPRPTSMIIYEYRTDRGLMCAVAYRHTSGEKPAYRFLAEGFSDDYFSEIREGRRCYAEGRELGRLWNAAHLECSKQIEVTIDYRAVIQGDAELINRADDKELRKLAVQFSLSGKVGKMRYIDKMATAILGRSGNMERIKSMLADIMQEDNVVPPSINLHRGIKNEIVSLGILRDLDRNEELFHSVIAKGTSYQENAQGVGHTHAELDSIGQKLTNGIVEQERTLEDLREMASSLSAGWDSRSYDLKDQVIEAKTSVSSLERQLNKLHEAYQRWEDNDIHNKIADYEQLDRLHELHDAARQRLSQLEEGVEDIQRQYNENTALENTRHHKAANKLQAKIRELENTITAIREKWAERKIEIIQGESREKDRVRESYQHELDDLRNQIARAEQESKHSHATENEKNDLDIAEAACDENRDLVKAQEAVCEQASQKQDAMREKRRQADTVLAQSTRDADTATTERDDMLALCRPEPGSVLAQFRDKQPLWYNTIGRVMRPELLTRKDLSPVLSDKSKNEMFGWHLALDRIDQPAWATTLEDQERRLRVCEDELDRALAYQQECEKQLAKANNAFAAERDSSDEAKRQLSRRKGRLEAAIEAVKRVKLRNSEAAYARKQEAKLRLKSLLAARDEATQRQQQAIESVAVRTQSIINEGMSQASTDESRLDNEAGAYRTSLDQEKTGHKAALKTLKSDYDAQRSERGLDENVILEAETSVSSTRAIVARAEGYAKPVAEYSNWLDVEWGNYDTLAASLLEAEATRDDAVEQVATKEAEYKRQRDALNARKQMLEEQLRINRGNSSECAAMMLRLTPPLSPLNIGEPRSLDIVMAEAQMLIDERVELKNDIRLGVGKAESLILKGGDDSQIAKAWQALVQVEKDKLTAFGDNDIDEELLTLNKTQALDLLLRVQLTQLRESLTLFIENVGQQVIQYYLGMRDISSAIKSQSRQISDSIGNTLHFDAISDVKVSLKSRIDNEDFWPILESFYDTWRSWKESGSSSIPPPEVDQQLMRAVEILHRSNIHRPLSGLFDLEISLCENGRWVTARKAEELEDASSNGLSYLILCCIYAGISRMLCRDRSVKIHWPMDELGTLAPENITRLFAMLDEYGIVMIGGFPTTDPTLLQHFTFHHDVQTSGGIVEMALPEDELAQAIAERNATATET